MSPSRLLPFLMLLALVMAPFGRTAEARPMPHHQAMPMASHCADRPGDAGTSGPMSIDCMIACAAVTPVDTAGFAPPPPAAVAAPATPPAASLAGIRPEAEPPPPRS